MLSIGSIVIKQRNLKKGKIKDLQIIETKANNINQGFESISYIVWEKENQLNQCQKG